MKDMVDIFIAGVVLANGPCLLFCAPIVLPCVSGMPRASSSGRSWKKGLSFGLVFSISRLVAYGLLGFLSVALYRTVFGVIAPGRHYFKAVLGVIVLGTGILYLVKGIRPRQSESSACAHRGEPREKGPWHMALAGLLIGFSPCPPLLAVLTYIAATAGDPARGLALGLAFGLGTVLTPLIPFSALTGVMVDRLRSFPRTDLFIRVLSALVLVYLGIMLFLSG